MKIRDKLLQLYQKCGVESSLETFSNRKRLQKLTYLMEIFGLNLGFRFSWYLYGPYSNKLTAVLYDTDENQSDREVSSIFPDEENILKKLINFLGKDIHSSRNLELIVSLHYLSHATKQDNLSDEDIIDHLIKLKPQYTKEESKFYLKKLHDDLEL